MTELINWKLVDVLKYIEDNKDINFMKIQNHFNVNPSTVNRWITYFLKYDFIRRKKSTTDIRVLLINITPKGKNMIKTLKYL